MEQVFKHLKTIQGNYQNDITYLQNYFTDELLKKLMQDVRANYDEVIDKYLKDIKKYFIFDVRLLGSIIASIVSIFEGHLFCYQDVLVIEKEDNQGYFYHRNYLLIVDTQERRDNYTQEEIDELIKMKKAIVLKKNSFSSKTKRTSKSWTEYEEEFYTVVSTGVESDTFLRTELSASYIKDFIDFVIDARIEKKIEKIDEATLLVLRKEFIQNKCEEITRKNQEYDQAREEDVERQITLLRNNLNKEREERKRLFKKIEDCEL